MAYIYKIVNDINDKIYIGKTSKTPKKRFIEHCKDSKCRRNEARPLYNAMNKYGIDHFSYEMIEECSEETVCEREVYWISFYDSYNNGYNATLGGEGKPYIDKDLIVKTYLENHNIHLTAKILGIDQHTASFTLKEYKIDITPASIAAANTNGKKVKMLDKENSQELKTFDNQTEAARWLIENNYTTSNNTTKISNGIGRVCNGKRKTAYGFKWERI